ncbi:hypothetical protein GCM10010358_80430 [Streptomyces minutiscleroticus]|uniref:Transposase IS110-like N-terminal domain-containing protein n=1 Tax=Streptomyces minutiscleroticus TaxID=68238 RepID=A0A918P2S8_9ACTN|nr:transposase [Streptomyces minutiscleroticus]GGY16724.1 hypothetical protein GCM10010358_80430 [Streptomyces minutiscleroticus]
MTAHGPARQAPRKTAHATNVVLGVDTHKDVHVATVLTTLGALLATGSFPTTQAGYVDLLARARSFGTVRQAGVEGTGSYGASLCRYLLAEGVQVIEVNRPDRAARRQHGKSDAGETHPALPAATQRTGQDQA